MSKAQRNSETRPSSPVHQLAPSRIPISGQLATEFDVRPLQWRVLVDQIFPSAKSVEAIAMALEYCRSRNLDIMKKPVHIVPMWSAAKNAMVETVWPGIAEIRTTAARTGEYAGISEVEFGPTIERTFEGSFDNWENGRKVGQRSVSKTVRFPEWASVTVYRFVKGHKSAFHAKVFWEETYASTGKTEVPNEMWSKRPRGQLDKCVEAAAIRKAFPEEVGNEYVAEEMEGRILHDGGDVAPRPSPPSPPRLSSPPSPTDCASKPSEPEPAFTNPEEVFRDAEERLCVVDDIETWEEVWSEFQHMQETLSEENWDRLVSIGMEHRERVGA